MEGDRQMRLRRTVGKIAFRFAKDGQKCIMHAGRTTVRKENPIIGQRRTGSTKRLLKWKSLGRVRTNMVVERRKSGCGNGETE